MQKNCAKIMISIHLKTEKPKKITNYCQEVDLRFLEMAYLKAPFKTFLNLL